MNELSPHAFVDQPHVDEVEAALKEDVQTKPHHDAGKCYRCELHTHRLHRVIRHAAHATTAQTPEAQRLCPRSR